MVRKNVLRSTINRLSFRGKVRLSTPDKHAADSRIHIVV